MQYVLDGTFLALGPVKDAAMVEVHKSNMAKLVDGKPTYKAPGRVAKPFGWRPPNLLRFVCTHLETSSAGMPSGSHTRLKCGAVV